MNRKPWIYIALLLTVISCRRNSSESPPTIVISGDTSGWIVPCGCTSNQSGGLPRRGTFLEQRRRLGPVVFADAGGAANGGSVYDRLKFEAILKGELAMGIVAHNLGRSEIDLGPDYLRRIQKELAVPFLSANTTDSSGAPIAEPMIVVESAGRRILFVGVIDPKYQTEQIRVDSPHQAVRDVLRKAEGSFDRSIVLAYMPEDSLRQLAEKLPEVDAVVGGPTGQPIEPSHRVGFVLLTSATKQGKFMTTLQLPGEKDETNSICGEIVELDGNFRDDPLQVENVKRFYEELKRRDLSSADTSFVDIPSVANPGTKSPAIAGSEACKSCHDEDYRDWKKSKHAQAWNVLIEKDASYNPDCQRCHVTGYGQPGGFQSVKSSPSRVSVGCESCHGMSSAHCRNTAIPTQWAGQTKHRCQQCHDRENSPQFDYESYNAKIPHGKPATSPKASGSLDP